MQGVESEKCSSFTNAMQNGAPIYTPNLPTLADGLAVPCVGYNGWFHQINYDLNLLLSTFLISYRHSICHSFALARQNGGRKRGMDCFGYSAFGGIRKMRSWRCRCCWTCSNFGWSFGWIQRQKVESFGHWLLQNYWFVSIYIELESFCYCVEVILIPQYSDVAWSEDWPLKGDCWSNFDVTFFVQFPSFSLSSRFIATVSDRPGGISDLCKLMASVGVSIKDIMHERAFIRDIYSVEVHSIFKSSRSVCLIKLYHEKCRWKWFARHGTGLIRKSWESF